MVAQISFGAMRCYRASHRAPSDMRLSYQVKPLFLPLCHKPTIISKEHNGQGQRPLIAAERNRRPSNYFCRSLSLAAILFNKNGKRNGKALAGSQEESAPCILLEDNAIAIRVKRDKRKLGENVHFGREWLARAANSTNSWQILRNACKSSLDRAKHRCTRYSKSCSVVPW